MSTYFVMIREMTTDAEALAEYGPKASLAAQGHPLKPLAIYGAMDQLEGDAIEGAVIIEFPDMAAARAWTVDPIRPPSSFAKPGRSRKPSSSKACEFGIARISERGMACAGERTNHLARTVSRTGRTLRPVHSAHLPRRTGRVPRQRS
jgi:uncharacterized protein (DUF1330 family)